jgi:chromosomal replication initiator protein
MRRIAKACAAHFGINVNLLYIESRKAKVCHARMIAYYLCRQLPRSFPQIGAHFRGRDHTTILHGVNKIRRRLACGDQQLHADIEAIRSAVWSNVADCCPTCGSVSVKGDVDGFAE